MLATAVAKSGTATDSPAPLASLNGAVDREEAEALLSSLPPPVSPTTVPEPVSGQLSLPMRQSSLSDYPSADTGDSLLILDELLDDIRRSRTASLASTPTQLSSDCENESVIQCEEGRRSEAELRGMGEWAKYVYSLTN